MATHPYLGKRSIGNVVWYVKAILTTWQHGLLVGQTFLSLLEIMSFKI